MKVAIYTIAKNEEQFVDRWADSCAEADYRLIVDTGSTDNTLAKAYENGVDTAEIIISPWRFDDARNAALALLPADIDYCIALDMDEILLPGWRDQLEQMHDQQITRPRYKYTWSWKPNGQPDLQYGGDKIHTRFGYRWKHKVHETLIPSIVEKQGWCDLEIHHHPDNSKSRGQYYELLAEAAQEHPTDDRIAFYYARELFYKARNGEALLEFQRYLALPSATWQPERSAAYRMMAKCDPDNMEHWLKMAVLEASDRREPWYELAHFHYERQNWRGCYMAASTCLTIVNMPLEYLCESHAWGASPHDLAAISAHHLGLHKEAAQHGTNALNLEPDNERLKANLGFYADAIATI